MHIGREIRHPSRVGEWRRSRGESKQIRDLGRAAVEVDVVVDNGGQLGRGDRCGNFELNGAVVGDVD